MKAKLHTGTGLRHRDLIDAQADVIATRVEAGSRRRALVADANLDAVLREHPDGPIARSMGKLRAKSPEPDKTAVRAAHGIHPEWDSRQVAYEAYLRSGTESRDLYASTTTGAYLVAPGFMPDVLRGLTFANALLSRARIWISDTGAPASFPLAGADTALSGAKIGEGTQVTESDIAFTQASFPSCPLWVLAGPNGLMRVGRALLQDEKVNLPALISDVMSARLARGLDSTFMATLLAGGFGVSTTVSPTAVTFADIAAWVNSIDAVYRYSPGAAMIVSPSTAAIIRAMSDTGGRPLTLDTPYVSVPFDNSIAGGTDRDAQGLRFPSLLNMPILESAAVPNIGAGNIIGIAGDFSRAFVARFPADSFSVLRLQERYSDFNQIGFIGYSRADGVCGLTAAAQILKCHA
jgi:HK97 family phage major capsid protein